MLKLITRCCCLVLLLPAFSWSSEYSQDRARVTKSIEFLQKNVSYIFQGKYQVHVVEKKNVENAWVLGSKLLVTIDLLKKLNDRELLALVAHEVAHVEKLHFATQLGHSFGGFILSLFGGGEEGFYKEWKGFLDYIHLVQEFEADCMAYNWLRELEEKGFEVSPSDLNSASESIIGLELSSLEPLGRDFPPFARYLRIKEGYTNQCNFLPSWTSK